jgi:hypothetical protein
VPGGTAVNPRVQSPSNPQLASAADANLPSSGGFEGMALDASGTKLYPLLEKAINGDPVRERLLVHEFSLQRRAYTGRTWGYLMDAAQNAIGDMTALSDRTFLVIERDNGQGDAADPRFTSPARFKKIFRIDLDDVDGEGNLVKQEVVDLLNLYDPRDVAADGRTQTVFTFPFVTIEDVLPLDACTLVVVNDNNFPFSAGRTFGAADANEFVLLHTAPRAGPGGCRCHGPENGHGHGHGHEGGDRDDRR